MNFHHRILRDSEAEGGGGESLDFDSMLRSSMEELLRLTQAHQSVWGFGTEEEWQLDQDQGSLIFKFPGRTAIAPVQIIGTYDLQASMWMWAWANPLIANSVKADSVRLKEYGEQHGIQRLAASEWLGQESDCWYMAALACFLAGANGAYRGPAADTYTFMTFRELAHHPAPEDRAGILAHFKAETAAEFKACAGDITAQKNACCRYFRRGAVLGLSQSDLIDCLGLAVPSILEEAGYSSDEAEHILNLVGEISDVEIQNACASNVA